MDFKVKLKKKIQTLSLDRQTQVYLIWQTQLKSPSVVGQAQASLPACLSAGVFAHTRMGFETTQLWRQIACSSLQGPELSSLTQMFTFVSCDPTHCSSLPVQSDHWEE